MIFYKTECVWQWRGFLCGPSGRPARRELTARNNCSDPYGRQLTGSDKSVTSSARRDVGSHGR